MTRKLLVLSFALVFLLGTIVLALENDVIPIQIEKPKKPALINKHGYLYPGKNREIVPIEKVTATGDLPHGFLFNYDDLSSEYYLGRGTAGDEFAIWFQSPQAACSLYAVDLVFYPPERGGTINLNVMAVGNVSPDTVANEDSVAAEGFFGDNLMGEGEDFPLEIQAIGDWERFVFPEWGYNIDVERKIFWIHWTKTGDAPMLLADDGNQSDYLHTWAYMPNYYSDESTKWKWGHYGWPVDIEAFVRCEVVFYEDPPPVVVNFQMWDTYDVGPHTLYAVSSDGALDPADEGVVSGTLYYQVDRGDTVMVTATVTGDTAKGFVLEARVPAGAVGDSITYWFEAVDKVGNVGRSSPPLSFEITEPVNTGATVLVLDQGSPGVGPNLEDIDEIGYYLKALSAHGFWPSEVEVWSTDVHHGYDASVIGYGWNTILTFSWAGFIPTRDYSRGPGKALADFLDKGGNMLFADMDYLWVNGEPGDNPNTGDLEDTTFSPGDFAYDYFGIEAGVSDPSTIVGQDAIPAGDSVFTGVADDPISGEFADKQIENQFPAIHNWADFITPRQEAHPVFIGESGNIAAVRYEGTSSHFKTAYFAFNLANMEFEDPGPSQIFLMIVQNFLDWVEATHAVETEAALPNEYALQQNYPNPFNPATVVKFDLPKAADVKLVVYTILGQEVTTLVNRTMNAGRHSVVWNGTDASGKPMGSGLYIYRLTAGDFTKSRKMLLLR